MWIILKNTRLLITAIVFKRIFLFITLFLQFSCNKNFKLQLSPLIFRLRNTLYYSNFDFLRLPLLVESLHWDLGFFWFWFCFFFLKRCYFHWSIVFCQVTLVLCLLNKTLNSLLFTLVVLKSDWRAGWAPGIFIFVGALVWFSFTIL